MQAGNSPADVRVQGEARAGRSTDGGGKVSYSRAVARGPAPQLRVHRAASSGWE